MKGKKGFLLGIVIGAFFGWGLSNFLMPFDVARFSFLLGFVACLVLGTLVMVAWLFWKKKSNGESLPRQSKPLVWLLASCFVLLTGILGSFLMIRQNDIYKAQLQHQEKKLIQQDLLMQSIRNSGLGALMNNIFDKIDNELANNPTRTLSESTIDRIAALSYSIKPYGYLQGDSLSSRKLSPERGQLLLALSKMELDSNSFNKIKFKSTFSEADLLDANLRGADLQWANLNKINLKGADLREANLSGVKLRGSNLWGAKLNAAKLNGADLRRCDFRWANLNDVDLRKADLRGVDMTNTKLNNIDATDGDLQWSYLTNAFLKNANLAGIKMLNTNFDRANLTNANLSKSISKLTKFKEAILRNTDLSGANLSGADFSNADLTEANLIDTKLSGVNLKGSTLHQIKVKEKDWFKKLTDWKVRGVEGIENKYKIVADPIDKTIFRVVLINKK